MTILSPAQSDWIDRYKQRNAVLFNYKMVKPMPDEWIEKTIFLPKETTPYPGYYSFDRTPYMRRIVNHLHPSDPVRTVTLMKGSQSGATAGLVVPGICYLISESPTNILLTAADLVIAGKTVEQRLDPILRSSNLIHHIRPSVVKKTNNRTGDTKYEKEFGSGNLTVRGTNSADTFRMFSAQIIFADDFDAAPRELGESGDVRTIIEGRQNSYGDRAKTFFISTPKITQTSNIFEQYSYGTQNKWHWPCPHCGVFMPMDWQIKLGENNYAGMFWELDSNKKLIKDSVFFKCPHCEGLVKENDKYELNLLGEWRSTVEQPVESLHESYSMNGIINPPGFTGWVRLVEEWLKACPPGQKAVVKLLKAFNNERLGLPFEEMGDSPRVNELMQNTKHYHPGIIPDDTCEKDGNGKIIMLTLACDINGPMTIGVDEDTRLDWEILAHTSCGQTYSVDHGSIGTFKRARDIKKSEEDEYENKRMKWTLVEGSMALNEHGEKVNNCAWVPFEEVISKVYTGESGKEWSVNITVVDTGHAEKLASQFIDKMQQKGLYVYGVKGKTDENGRKLQRDTNPVKRSTERPRSLYILEVDQLKDDLSDNMKLREGDDGAQPNGFMNFPESRDGKYDMKHYFSHYEGERRKQVLNSSGSVVGFKWVKKNNQVQNHFWDVRIYNLAAPYIWVDLLQQSDPQYKNITWEESIQLILSWQ